MKALVVLSGGQDSTTCLYWAKQLFEEVEAVTFNYGQRHARELDAARIIASMAQVSHEIVDIGPILKGTSPLVNKDAELEQYKDHQSLPGGIEKTFVPMRNQLFLTIAANRAVCLGADRLVTGVCEEDYGGYPDCRHAFIESLEHTINVGTWGVERCMDEYPLRIDTPLMRLTKAETVQLALGLNGCYRAIAYSHTAYDGHYPPVGKDHATLLRAKGFEEAMVPDPLILRACKEGLMELPITPNYTSALVESYSLLAGLS